MGNDDKLGELGERLARLEARQEQIPSGPELYEQATTAGKMGARSYMDGLTESFQKDTHARLEELERGITRMRSHMVIVNAVILAIGFAIGQKVPPLIP